MTQETASAQLFRVAKIILALWISCASAVVVGQNGPVDSRVGEPIAISGRVEIADSDPSVAKLSIWINGSPAAVNKNGTYNATIPEADVYQLRIGGEEVFASVQTFAHIELQRSDARALLVPKIELVAKKPGRVELVFGGDVMMGRRYLEPRWNELTLIRPETRVEDMKQLVEPIAPYFRSSDYAAINLESILAEEEPPKHAPKSVVFYTHPDVFEALEKMGVDYVSLGNNHTYDYLDHGLRTTLDALDESGLGYSGAGFDEDQALAAYRTNIKGQDYSMLGYVGWVGRVTPNQVAEKNKAGAAMGSKENIVASVGREAAAKRVTVVQYHGSREYSEGPTEITEERLKAAVDSGADLVIGHHPHVGQGVELYKGKLIAWSLGNFLFDQFFYSTHGAYALKVWMDGEEFYRAEIIPLQIKAYRPIPAMADVRRHVLQRVMTLSAKRDTHLHLSGGHAVVTAASDQPSELFNRTTHLRKNGGMISKAAYRLSTGAVDVNENKVQATGRDLFFRGDFESYGLLDLEERSWETKGASAKLVRTAWTGRFALELAPDDEGKPVQLGLKTFMRVLNQDRYSLTFWVKTGSAKRISAFIQSRPQGMNRYKALEQAELRPIGSETVGAGEWTQVSFDYEVDRSSSGRALPTRPIIRFEPVDGKDQRQSILVDDLAVIGWDPS